MFRLDVTKDLPINAFYFSNSNRITPSWNSHRTALNRMRSVIDYLSCLIITLERPLHPIIHRVFTKRVSTERSRNDARIAVKNCSRQCNAAAVSVAVVRIILAIIAALLFLPSSLSSDSPSGSVRESFPFSHELS